LAGISSGVGDCFGVATEVVGGGGFTSDCVDDFVTTVECVVAVGDASCSRCRVSRLSVFGIFSKVITLEKICQFESKMYTEQAFQNLE
jgi:hypothetical protein